MRNEIKFAYYCLVMRWFDFKHNSCKLQCILYFACVFLIGIENNVAVLPVNFNLPLAELMSARDIICVLYDAFVYGFILALIIFVSQ